MGVRNDLIAWSDNECRRLAILYKDGATTEEVVEALNREFHAGRPVRNYTAVRLKRGKLKVWIGPKKHQTPLTPPVLTEQQVETRATEDATEVKSVGSKIKSVEDLLRHIGADLTRFEVERSEATKWETATVDPQTGKPVVTELRVSTADNDINAIKQMGAIPEGYCVNHFLTDTNGWYLTTDVPNGMKHFVRTPLQNSMDGDFDTGNVRYKARERYSFGVSDPLGIFGSPGSS